MDANKRHRVTLTKFITPAQLGAPVEWLPGLSIVTSKRGYDLREQVTFDGPLAEAVQRIIDQSLASGRAP